MRQVQPAVAGVAAALAAATPLAAAAPAAAASKKPPRITIGVFDNYYAPIPKKALKKGTVVRWKWDVATIDVHDVKLEKGPKGVKKYHSAPLAGGQSFTTALSKPGVYKFICTFHVEMKATLRVAKS